MLLASVSKLNIHLGDPVYDRLIEEFNAAQEEGLLSLDLDINGLDDEIRMDLQIALSDLGYRAFYNANEEMLEISYE